MEETLQTLSELFSPGRVLLSAFILLLTWLFSKVLQWLSKIAARQVGRYRLQMSRVYPVARLILWVAAFYVVIFRIIGPPYETMIAVLASVGVALGLGAQDLVKNVLAGIVLLFDQPFSVGDMVRVDGHYGEVTEIGLRSIRIHTFDDSMVTVPNSVVLTQAVSNSNSGELDEMVVIDFSLPASVNVEEVKSLAWEAASSSPYIFLKKPILVLVEDRFDRTFLTHFKVKCYVLDVRFERRLASDILERIKSEAIKRNLITEDMIRALANGR